MVTTQKKERVIYRDKEVWLERVKRHALHGSFHVLEGCLRISPTRLVNPYRSLSRARCCKIPREKGKKGSQLHLKARLFPGPYVQIVAK